MPLHIFSHNENSEGARNLSQSLGARRIRHEGSRYRGGPGKVVINWGSSRLPEAINGARILNLPARVAAMSNKLSFFQIMDDTDVRIPEWTTSYDEAAVWAQQSVVVGRRVLNGHSAAGVEIYENMRNVLDTSPCPLYTKYVKKAAEYRIHFAFGEIIDIQRKIKDPNREVTDWKVRNHANGFIFVRNGVADALPVDVRDQSNLCIQEAGLDFGAIDIIYNASQQHAYVLEINTAPGITGETVRSYHDAFQQFV